MSSTLEPASKRARLQHLRSKLPFVTQHALAAILSEAHNHGLPEPSSRRSIARARDAAVQHVTPYGPLHRTIPVLRCDGSNEDVEIQDPFAMMYDLANTSAKFAAAVQAAAATRPSTPTCPWSLILYTDEILPGNQLGYKSARKMWGFYWTVHEFGTSALSDEELSRELCSVHALALPPARC